MKIFLPLFILLLFTSCQTEKQTEISEGFALDFKRTEFFWEKIYDIPVQTPEDTLKLYNKYFKADKQFWSEWIFQVKQEAVSDTLLANVLVGFGKNKYVKDLIDSVKKQYPPNYDFVGKFKEPVALLLEFFPRLDTPKIRTAVLGYNYNVPAHISFSDQVFYNKKYIGIGLHYMLGPYFSFYHPQIPFYIRWRTQEKFLLPNVFHQVTKKLHPELTAKHFPTFLDEMINAGIRHYILEKILRNTPPQDIFYYNDKQWKWANENEAALYKIMLPLLYEQDYVKYREFIGEAPFTKRFGKESPPRLGQFIGWKIVKTYMEKHPEVSLEELASYKQKDYKKLFKEAKYKP